MSEQAVLRNVSKVLADPKAEENAQALQAYLKAKEAQEELARKQREWMRAKHGA